MKNRVTKPIPYGRQTINERDITFVLKQLRSDHLTQGPTISGFENCIKDYCGARYAVAFSSGTAALHGACFAAGITAGDEVITTPMTFAASANCVLYCGGVPVFADIRSDLPLIDVTEVQKRISKKTRAIIPVDYSGMPADYDEINALAKKNNLIVISDAAHSLGAMYKGRKVGKLADMTVLSFHPVKLITTGEGGMVVTDNKAFYERLLIFRTHGITKLTSHFINHNEGGWYHEMQELGYNYRLTDIQAALGMAQMKRIGSFLLKRRRIARKYYDSFAHMEEIKPLVKLDDRSSAWHIFPIQFFSPNQKHSRKWFFDILRKNNIYAQVHYIPVHMHPYYTKKFGYKRRDFPRAEAFYDSVISLPIFPTLSNSDFGYIIKTIRNILK